MTSPLPSVSFRAIGTTASVLTSDGDGLDLATAVVRAEVDALDVVASRFRADSELARLNSSAGRAIPVSSLLLEVLEDALAAAEETDGLVTPTVGDALIGVGYDRDFDAIASGGPPISVPEVGVPPWRRVHLDRGRATAHVPLGVRLDLGATAKAGCADRAARTAASATGRGVLVNLGGDISLCGPAPAGGWPIRVAERHDDPADAESVTIALFEGGLATSGTVARRWCRSGTAFHHLIDPRTGSSAAPWWRTVTVAAGSCLEANAASTAAVVLGPRATAWLDHRGLPARLVAEDGQVASVGHWPAPVASGDLGQGPRVG